MAITRKKFETFDIDYSKDFNGKTYYVKGTVTVRLADNKISDMNVTIYDEDVSTIQYDTYRYRQGTISYNEIGNKENGDLPVYGNFNVSNELAENFTSIIVKEVKSDLFEE